MSTKIKGLPPRVALRIKDSATGSYPSIPRTGDDSRRGSYSVRYDDTDTINFIEVPDVVSSTLTTKRDPKFNLLQNEGNYQSANNLLHYWQFEDGSDPTSDTGLSGTADLIWSDSNTFTNDHRNTPSTGSVYSSGLTGPAGRAWTGALNNSASLALGDGSNGFDRTFSCWVNKIDSLPVTESIIFARSSSVSQGHDTLYEFGIIGSSGGDVDFGSARTEAVGSLFFRIFDPSVSSATEGYLPGFFNGGTAAEPDITYGKWWHLAITYSGTFDTRANSDSLNFYINGKKSTAAVLALFSGTYNAPENTTSQLSVGAAGVDFGSLSRAWGGLIDDFAVYDKVLGEHEIAEIAGFKRGISYPVGLEANSSFSKEIERTDIFAPGTVRKGISDNFISFTPGESITPFNESFRPEQSRTGSFYLTGTDPSAAALGFSSKLSSKTQIKFEFDIQSASTMNANTASIVYFNKDSGQFDLAGGEEALSEPAANEERGMAGRDCKLFNAIGMALMSGTGIPGSGQSPPSPFHGNTSFTIDSAIDQALIFKQPQSVPLNPLFSASIPQRIPLSGVITAPFLLEKAVIELPISSSDGWFNDQTFALSDGTFTFSDLGGPCVTVSLMNQLAANRRELILSATIIPEGDNTSFTRQGSDSILGPAGFASFATPNAVVQSAGEQTVTLQAQPSIANGVIAPTTGGIDFKDAFIGEVSPFCRAFDVGSPSARSYFGKEYTIPRFNNALPTRYDETIFSGTAHSDLFIFEDQEISPYLLLPTDELILAVSKYRSVMTSILSRNPTTSSHEFGFPEGTIKMTLYGSLIKENKEFHDTLNQNLTSEAVHEYIHFDNPVIDQFDVEPRSSFSGSYIAEFFTGSMLISGTYDTSSYFSNGYLDQRRGVRASIIGTSNTLIDRLPVFFGSSSFRVPKLGFNRATSHFSDNERYFDTLLPRPDQISNIEGADILHDTTLNRNFYLIGRGASFIAANWIESWDMLYPFESKYASVTRTATPFRDTLSTLNTALSPLVAQSSEAGLYRPESVNNTEGTVNSTRIMHGAFASSAALTYLPVPNDILAKALFTIGDGQYNEPIGISLNAGGSVAYDVLSRGFKYGILNSNVERKKWKFRRDRYGQVRDMLEQARDSKIYIEDNGSIVSSPVRVRFVDSSGSAVEPENTFASNMSSEATSSLPYFDDVSRNRGALPSVVAV